MSKILNIFRQMIPPRDWFVVLGAVLAFVLLAQLTDEHWTAWQFGAPPAGAALGLVFFLRRESPLAQRAIAGIAILLVCCLLSFLFLNCPEFRPESELGEILGIFDLAIEDGDPIWFRCFVLPGFGFLWGAVAALTGKSCRWALPVAALMLLLLPAAFLAGATGLVTLLQLGDIDQYSWMLRYVVIAFFLLALVAASVFTVCFARKEQFVFRRFAITFGAVLLVAGLLWGAALGYAELRASAVEKQIGELGLKFPENPRGTEALQATDAAYQAISDFRKFPTPPSSDVNYWRPPSESSNVATEEHKQMVLAADRSEEVNRFYDALEKLLAEEHIEVEDGSDTPTHLQYLTRFREYARRLRGRAELSHYRNDGDKAVYWAGKSLRFGEVWPGDHSLVSQLVRVAIDNIAYSGAVSLTPNDPKYLPVYLEWLELLKKRRYDQVGEPLYLGSQLKLGSRICLGDIQPEASWLCRIYSPLSIRLLCDMFDMQLQADRDHRQARLNLKQDLPAYPDGFRKNYLTEASRRMFQVEAMGQIAMALKIYRVKYGHYPETLEKLVPEFLDRVPPDPLTGKPPEYVLKDDEFELKANGRVMVNSRAVY